jgi:hypothetical protein
VVLLNVICGAVPVRDIAPVSAVVPLTVRLPGLLKVPPVSNRNGPLGDDVVFHVEPFHIHATPPDVNVWPFVGVSGKFIGI